MAESVLPSPVSDVFIYDEFIGPSLQITPSSYIHFEDILEQIPECRQLIRKMKKMDRDAYRYHKRMGARLGSQRGVLNIDRLHDEFRHTLPAAGMVYFCDRVSQSENVFPRFLYFLKIRRKMDFSRFPLNTIAFYRVSAAFIDVTKTDGRGKPVSGYVDWPMAVSADGRATLVYETQTKVVSTPNAGHTKRIGSGRSVRVGSRSFRSHTEIAKGGSWSIRYAGYSSGLEGWVSDSKRQSVEDLTSELFYATANTFSLSAAEDFQVRAERDGVSVAFSVALGRTPFFFKDRQTTVASDGRRKRIFHAVAAHERELASGKISWVRAHYRGERTFMWHGEHISITAPEHNLMSWTAPAIEHAEEDIIPPAHLTMGETADFVRPVMEKDYRGTEGNIRRFTSPTAYLEEYHGKEEANHQEETHQVSG